MRLAVVTMVYNEVDYMDLWCRHYGAQVGAAHCFVVDHGSDDGTTEGLDPVNVIRIPRSPQDDAWRAGMISRLCAELLKSYDVVIYVDVDEFLVADPRYHRNLIDCARAMTGPVMTAIGLEVWHLADSQPAIDITRPISLQRDWVWFNSGLCKAAMIREAVDWSPGFHSTASPVAFDHLFLFHLRYFDVERGLRRLARTRAMPWAFDYSGRHQRVSRPGLGAGSDAARPVGGLDYCAAFCAALNKSNREYRPKAEPLSRNPPPGPSVAVRMSSACDSVRDGKAIVSR
jgi:hypothetical protein